MTHYSRNYHHIPHCKKSISEELDREAGSLGGWEAARLEGRRVEEESVCQACRLEDW